MPQGDGGHRGVAFSGKQKRQQLRAKHQRRQHRQEEGEEDVGQSEVARGRDVHHRPSSSKSSRDRYALQFKLESSRGLAELKAMESQGLAVASKSLLYTVDDFHSEAMPMPTRPAWSHTDSKSSLEQRERAGFDECLRNIDQMMNIEESIDVDQSRPKAFSKDEHTTDSYYERNLETWRQLWRVLEMADIVIVVVDIRYAPAMFPLQLFHYLMKQNKSMILVLNKVDLVPLTLSAAWRRYFERRLREYGSRLRVTFCSSCTQDNLRHSLQLHEESLSQLKKRRMRAKLTMVTKAALQIVDACEDLMKEWPNAVDLSSWRSLITSGTSSSVNKKAEPNELVLGIVGQPNAGKSSLINALFGQKVVSVSKTPGHTKHFQTHFICPKVKICDSPGLVFPSRVPKALQVVMGSFPIAQTRAPLYCVRYIAEHINLPSILGIETMSRSGVWSPFSLCEAFAKKRELFTAKGSRPDVNRAANLILRMTLEGKITLALQPTEVEDESREDEKAVINEYVTCIEDMLGIGQLDRNRRDDADESTSDDSNVEGEEEEVVTNNKFDALLLREQSNNENDEDS